MVEHVDENAWKEKKHMVAEPMVSTSQPSKEHCNDSCINELLMRIITNYINLNLFIL